MKLKEILEKAVKEYNKYRSPEVNAEFVSLNENILEIKFSGIFCYTCGFYDYFDDFRYILKEMNVETKIIGIKEFNEESIVKFKVER